MKITLDMVLDYYDFIVSKNRSDQHLYATDKRNDLDD